MKTSLALGDVSFSPPYFIAPMAGITHAPFRRLVSDFGGYGALFTEMLSVKSLAVENLETSPFTKRRPQEGLVWYQLLIGNNDDYMKGLNRLLSIKPDAIDINAACPAPEIVKRGAGAALFKDSRRLAEILKTIRQTYKGILSVKCRLGDGEEGWENRFVNHLRICEDAGIDALIVHPRFSFEKLKRRARWERFLWVCSQTKLPIIANGDITSLSDIEEHAEAFAPVSGVMIGRLAVVKPWILATPTTIDYTAIWQKMYAYILEDFEEPKALGRLKEFSAYYARNFFFGAHLQTAIQSAPDCNAIYERATAFLSTNPQVSLNPSVSGI